ncbi:hopanoid-associated sugar epimerase [Cupriavidus respiraculi]|uniref:Aurachin B dehydrogenase n=1 Tax=Cupriavidus respiraculi TaxID=195930 RepID=A0ABN7XYR9_9BURK|nr:hopanoid-associated sugar epimerase [Cupriavidus respiraculi]MBY4949780.1 NAD-dependent epimerase/dehydratase family protein [Cupriavidus respiraculi]CAG9165326.1 Aurachin B dehydrogenase [Cupriavidus respiraculi]
MGDDVLVTGASGFLGSAVMREALARGHRVRVLVRPASPRRNLEGQPVQVVEGDMRDAATMARALHGVRYLLHVAADYRLWARDPEEIVRANVGGTETVMRAALDCGVERIVYTSSVATLRVAGATQAVDETAPMQAHEAIGAYKRSKVLAERAVEAMIARDGLPAVIVNPSTPIGPRDVRPTPTGRVIVEAATGRIPAFVDTGLNLAHVDDVAAGHFLALERGVIGERYILGGDDVPLQTMLADIAALVGRRAPVVRLPRWPLYPLAHAAEAVARWNGREPFLTVDGLAMSRYRMFFRSDKARRELGYRARPYREGLRDALDWFRLADYLR